MLTRSLTELRRAPNAQGSCSNGRRSSEEALSPQSHRLRNAGSPSGEHQRRKGKTKRKSSSVGERSFTGLARVLFFFRGTVLLTAVRRLLGCDLQCSETVQLSATPAQQPTCDEHALKSASRYAGSAAGRWYFASFSQLQAKRAFTPLPTSVEFRSSDVRRMANGGTLKSCLEKCERNWVR